MKQTASRKFLSLITAGALTLSLIGSAWAATDPGLSRGEMAALLVEGAGLSDQLAEYEAKPSAFKDVAEGSTYEGAINLAYAKGLMSGTGNGNFNPNATATQVEAAAILLRYADVPDSVLNTWPKSYNTAASSTGLTQGVTYAADSAVTQDVFSKMLANAKSMDGKPFIGITWKSNSQDYAAFATVIRAAGGVPVELPQITSVAVGYDNNNAVKSEYLEQSGMLKQAYADQIKAKEFANTNVAQAMDGVDGVFFTGGEDISPSLFAEPQTEANHGEAINATRDISDYTLMAYCISEDIPTFAACRGMQMMSIVSGADFIQDIPDYYASQGASYGDLHRMPADAPNRDYARHDVDIIDRDSWLYNIVGDTQLANVSSWHHQAVKSVEGTELTVVAKTTYNGVDIIEGVENKNNTFCLGVQFHPENDCSLVLYQGKESPCDFDTCLKFFETLVAHASGKPVIGITWKSNTQDYAAFKTVIQAAGGIPYELPQVTSTAVAYDADGKIQSSYVEDSGMLKLTYANQVKEKEFSETNVVQAMSGIDGVFFTGGEDISPSLFAKPQEEANHGEEINATRDISDYTLMSYCIAKDIPTFAACRGMQMMSIVSGADFIQDIPDYYASQGAAYDDLHRMPADAPNRDYARHDVDIIDQNSWVYKIVGDTQLENVSSWHHQAVKSVEGTDLTVVAKTTDNGVDIIEGVENQNNTFCVGVQFHPENDCSLVLYQGKESPCDFDTCLNFFETLVAHAAA